MENPDRQKIHFGAITMRKQTIIGTIGIITIAFLAAVALSASAPKSLAVMRRLNPPASAMWLENIDLGSEKSWGSARPKQTIDGSPLMLEGMIYAHGLGSSSDGAIVIKLNSAATMFTSAVGVDDNTRAGGAIVFEVWTDGKKVMDSGVMKKGDKPKILSVDVTGSKTMYLIAVASGENTSYDYADWGGAMLVLDPNAKEKPTVGGAAGEPAPELAHTDLKKIGIHGPRIIGATPGRPFVFLIPATGEPPLTFSAENLPAGLSLDSKTGIISGSLKKEGETTVTLTVSDKSGVAKRKLQVAGGEHKLALTPPMGWNSWNAWGTAVDEGKVRAAADAFVSSGLASFGYSNINIDDAWEAGRDANGEILANNKFPDMKALSDYVHGKGLKLGIYSSPGPRTCGGYEASYKHELQDAQTWAKWGIDYLKYDWCSYGSYAKDHSLTELEKPYLVMRDALDKIGRDITFSLCQYGMGDVWTWGAEVGGNLWRVTGDINDSWASMSSIGFSQNGHEKFAGPGHWNDPDMLVVGYVGWGPNLHPSNLTHNEQITHITLWSMLSAPLLIGCDLTRIDQFTLDLLTNDEVLDINQDPLGKAARRVARGGMTEVWARPLRDGTIAVALFNRFFEKSDVTVKWSDVGVTGQQPVRSLWQKQNLGTFDGSFTTPVPAHGAVMLKIGAPKGAD
jgi:alpha-galactosidase